MEITQTVERLKQAWAEFHRDVARPDECLFCQGKAVWFNGSRLRAASVLIAAAVIYLTDIPCRRVKCKDCGKSWTLRPPGLCPHKHFQLCVVSDALERDLLESDVTQEDVAEDLGCSVPTVRRWRRWISCLAEPAQLQALLVRAVGAPILPRLPRLADSIRTAGNAACRHVRERAAQVLALIEVLGSAWGCEPPALRAVFERVVGNRTGLATYASPIIPEVVWRRAAIAHGTIAM
jgi:hypothetical protein